MMAQANPAETEWPLIKKLLLCFFFIFFVLYIVLNPNDVVPFSSYLHKLYIQPFTRLITWLARDIFHMVSPSIYFYNNTIDTVFGCLTILFICCISVLGALTWVFFYGGKVNCEKLYQTLILVLRYFLAISWIAYGSLKLIKLQFPSFTPEMLLQTYGNSTPKDLAWAFMGYSTGYNYFIGIIEYTAGLMLFFRRTSTLGNVIAVAALANVLAFNYCFDVNVKILSTVLMLMSLFLLTKDIKRLGDFFLFNKTVSPASNSPDYFNRKLKAKTLLIVKWAFILFITFFDLHGNFARAKKEGLTTIKPPLYGIYEVTVFIRNGDTVKPLATDTTRWNKLIVSTPQGKTFVMLMNCEMRNFVFKPDTLNKKITMYAADTTDKYIFNYDQPKSNQLLIHGKWRNDNLEMVLEKYDMNKFPLMRRGFRWIIDHHYKN